MPRPGVAAGLSVALALACAAACSDTREDAGGSDASSDVDSDQAGNACLSCASLEEGCSVPGLPCPPDLGTPELDAWAQAVDALMQYHTPVCFALPGCPELAGVLVGSGVDCASAYVFDVASKKLVAVGGGCNLHISCMGASACIPEACWPVPFTDLAGSDACFGPTEGGLDAGPD